MKRQTLKNPEIIIDTLTNRISLLLEQIEELSAEQRGYLAIITKLKIDKYQPNFYPKTKSDRNIK